MDPIPLEDLALLEVLQRVDQCLPMQSGDTEIRQRLVESGLVEEVDDRAQLTAAGIEMAKSLQHRVAADAQAAKVVEKRKGNGASHAGPGDDQLREA
jgi:predicted methyltransferase